MVDTARSLAQLSFRLNRSERFRIYRKLQGMMAMNEALSRCLERLYNNVTERGRYPRKAAALALKEWFERDRAGESLSEAMVGWVPLSELFMIKAGEEAGQVALAMQQILEMGDRSKEMKGAIIQAVGYPVFMLMLLGAVLWLFGVNMIEPMRQMAPPQVIASMGSLASVSDYIRSWGLLTLVFVIGLMVGLAMLMPVWRGHVRAMFDMFPPWSWYRLWQGSAFLLSMSALLQAQVSLKRALEVLEVQANPWLKQRIAATREEVMRGRNLGEALRQTNYNFPDPQLALDLEILSERSDVADVLRKVTDEWMREQIDKLRSQAQIVRYVGLGCVGAIIAWALSSIVGITTTLSSGGGGKF